MRLAPRLFIGIHKQNQFCCLSAHDNCERRRLAPAPWEDVICLKSTDCALGGLNGHHIAVGIATEELSQLGLDAPNGLGALQICQSCPAGLSYLWPGGNIAAEVCRLTPIAQVIGMHNFWIPAAPWLLDMVYQPCEALRTSRCIMSSCRPQPQLGLLC